MAEEINDAVVAEGNSQQKRKRECLRGLNIGGLYLQPLIDDLYQQLLQVDPGGAEQAVVAYRGQIAALSARNRALVGKVTTTHTL